MIMPLVLLTGCISSDTDKFIGKWEVNQGTPTLPFNEADILFEFLTSGSLLVKEDVYSPADSYLYSVNDVARTITFDDGSQFTDFTYNFLTNDMFELDDGFVQG